VREEGEDGRLQPSLPTHFPFRVAEVKGRGQGLVASREVHPGETLLTDSSILLGPASSNVCIVCCRGGECILERCSSCSHPLCQSCRATESHSKEECDALSKLGYHQDFYNLVLPIRFGLLKARDEDMYEWLLQYIDHNQERHSNNPAMQESVDRMATLVGNCLPQVGVEEASRIIGVLFTNCFEFKLAHIEARALYPLVSMVNHSCIPNIRHANLLRQVSGPGKEEGEMVVMTLEAARTIMPGTELTITYSDYMMSHLQRKRFLSEQWHFNCQCPRCTDPTEFGTMTSGLPCNACSTGLLLPTASESASASASTSESCPSWSCSKCGKRCPAKQVEERERTLVEEARQLPKPFTIRSCLEQLRVLSRTLHSNHVLVILLKQRFLFTFSIGLKKVRDLSAEQRLRLAPLFLAQEKYCRQLLAYHEVLDPGTTPLKTRLLHELRKVLLIQSRLLSDNPDASREELVGKLEELRGLSYLVCTEVPL